MKPFTILSAFILGVGLCFAGPDGKEGKSGECQKGACKKGASADAGAIKVVLDDDEAKPERRGPPKGERGGERGKRGGDRGPRGGGDRAEMFKKMDTDSSGGVSLAEMLAGMPARGGTDEAKRKEFITKMHAARDADGNGEVTSEEMAKAGGKGRRGGDRGARGGEKGGEKGGDRAKRPPLGD